MALADGAVEVVLEAVEPQEAEGDSEVAGVAGVVAEVSVVEIGDAGEVVGSVAVVAVVVASEVHNQYTIIGSLSDLSLPQNLRVLRLPV